MAQVDFLSDLAASSKTAPDSGGADFLADLAAAPPSSAKETESAAPAGADLLNSIALGGRAIGEGVAGTLALPHDLGVGLQNLMAKGIGNIPGIPDWLKQKTALQQPTFSQGFSNALTSAGAPVPTTPTQQMGSALVRGASSALTGSGLLSLAQPAMASLPNLLRSGASGVTSAGASEGVRQAGGGPLAQFGAGLLGGFVPAVAEGSVRTVGDLIGSVARPMTKSGQEQMAADVLARQATNPQNAAANLSNASSVVPGSARTAGEASQDPGLLAVEKGLRSRNPAAFGERISEQNAARQAELGTLGGTASDVKAAQAARDAATNPMRAAALASQGQADTTPVISTIDNVLASPAGARQSVSGTMEWARDLIGKETDPARLYEIRKDLQLAQMGKLQPSGANAPNASTLAQTRAQLGQVVSALDDSIESAAPGFKAYLSRYSDMSKPIDQMKVIQEIRKRAQLSAVDVTTGQPFLGSAAFGRALDQAAATNKLTPDQLQRLQAIKTDLNYGQAINSPLVKAPGSDTFQNLSIAQVLGSGITDAHPVFRFLTKPLSWVYKGMGSDEGVNQVLVNAMLDPKLSAQLLNRATPQSVQAFSNALRGRLSAYGAYSVGSGLGTRSTLAVPQVGTNTPPGLLPMGQQQTQPQQ